MKSTIPSAAEILKRQADKDLTDFNILCELIKSMLLDSREFPVRFKYLETLYSNAAVNEVVMLLNSSGYKCELGSNLMIIRLATGS